MFAAIASSNGWSPTTAALQLFAHLDGEALNVALLMSVEEMEQWTVLARGLSSYFNSPGRLAAVRRRFESASRRQGINPATFATELGIRAVRGFGNMGERARGLMIRNKFIAAQQSQALRRHLDGVSVEALIGEIVDSCRVWKSHAEAGCDVQARKFPHTISQVAEGTQPELGSMTSDVFQKSTGRVLQMPALLPPGVTCSSSDCELLIQRLMEVVRPGRSGIQERPQRPDTGLELRSSLCSSAIPGMDAPTRVPRLEEGMDPSSPVQLDPVLEVDPPVRGWDRVCFSCGQQGHGVSRCSRIDTSFPFLLDGWSVGVRNGRYQTTRTNMDGRNYTPGKGGWSGREGQPPGSSEMVVRLILEGERGPGGTPAGLATTIGGCPWIFLDLRCPGLSGTGEPLFCDGWTV